MFKLKKSEIFEVCKPITIVEFIVERNSDILIEKARLCIYT